MKCKNCEEDGSVELCQKCSVYEGKGRFLGVAIIGWFVAGVIASSLFDKGEPDSVWMSLRALFSFDGWISINGLANLLGAAISSNIPGVILAGIVAIFAKDIRNFRNFIITSAIINIAFALLLM